MALRLRVLGTPMLERDGQDISFDVPEAAALLAYLAVAGRPHPRRDLSALCWPGSGDADAAIAQAVAGITAAAGGGVLRDDGDALALDGDALSVDLHRVRDLQAQIAGHGHAAAEVCPACVAPLTAITRLHDGPFLDGLELSGSPTFEHWRRAVAWAAERRRLVALVQLSNAHVLRGELDAAAEAARRLLALDPLSEIAHRQLMRVHAWRDDPMAALDQYRECVRVLQRELGVSPLDLTTKLSEDVLAGRLPPAPRGAAWGGAEPVGAGDLVGAAEPAGGAEPVGAAEALGAAAPPRPRSRRRTPFVGREHELGMLTDAMARVGDDGLLVVVEGEGGIGRTRLLREFADHCARGGRAVLWAGCRPDEACTPFGAVIQLLRSLADDAVPVWLAALPPDVVREVRRLLPGIGGAAGPSAPAVGPGAVWRLVDALAAALASAALASAAAPADGAPPPGVLVVDDAHWIDPSSLQVLAHLADRLRGRPLGMVLAWRTELVSRGDRLRTLVTELVRRQPVRQIPLDRLDAGAVRVLQAELLGADWEEVGADSQRIMEITEGLPRVVVEHLEALAGHREHPRPAARDGVRPRTARVAALPALQWQVLTAGAVHGRPFDAATAREVSGRSVVETAEALTALVAADLLQGAAAATDAYDLADEDLRALVHAQTGPVRRRVLHRRSARALEVRAHGHTADASLAGAIATHWRAAGDAAAASVWFAGAGDLAARMLAVAEASAHHEAALALEPEDPGRLHGALGDLHLLEGRYAQALDRYEAAVALATEAELPSLEHRIAGVYLRLGRWVLAEEHLAIALAGLDAHTVGTTVLGARLLTDRGLVAQRRGRDDDARSAARAALDAARVAGDPAALAGAHNLLGVLSKHDLATARAHLERALEHARTVRDADLEIAAADNLAQVHAAAGALDRALPLAESAVARAAQMGDRHREATLRNTLAGLLRTAGRDAEAMGHLRRAVALFAEIGEPDEQPPEAWKLAAW